LWLLIPIIYQLNFNFLSCFVVSIIGIFLDQIQMWEEILFETVKVQAFLLAIEQVLVSEEDLDFLLAEWNAVLHNLGG
jgi:hypothetical protein